MTETVTAIEALTPEDALALSELIAAYVTETRRGAPRRPDRLYVERLLNEPRVEAFGAKAGERIVGYALFFDLPEIMTGRRFGQVDQLYVALDWRRRGVASRLLDALAAEGGRRGWTEVRLTVPAGVESALAFSAHRAEPARGETFRIPLQPAEPKEDAYGG